MKKLASFVLALAMAAVCAAPAMADNQITQSTSQSSDTTVKFNIAPSYTVTIPAATVIPFNRADTNTNLNGTLHLSAAQLELNHKITVTATANALKNDKDSSKTIPFTLYEGNTVFTSADFTDTTKQVQLSVHIDKSAWNAAPAGNYTGSVTFHIAYGG